MMKPTPTKLALLLLASLGLSACGGTQGAYDDGDGEVIADLEPLQPSEDYIE